MRKRFAVIGMGRFGTSVARSLTEMGQYVLAVEIRQEKVDDLAPVLSHVVRADSTDPAALKALRIADYDVVVVAIGDNVEASVITCLNCRDLGVKVLLANAQDEAHGRVLERLGVDRVIYPQRDMGARVAHNISAGGIVDFVRLSDRYGLAEVEASDHLVGRTLLELDLRNRYGLNVLAIKRGKNLIVSPAPDRQIEPGDTLVIIGEAKGIDRLQGG